MVHWTVLGAIAAGLVLVLILWLLVRHHQRLQAQQMARELDPPDYLAIARRTGPSHSHSGDGVMRLGGLVESPSIPTASKRPTVTTLSDDLVVRSSLAGAAAEAAKSTAREIYLRAGYKTSAELEEEARREVPAQPTASTTSELALQIRAAGDDELDTYGFIDLEQGRSVPDPDRGPDTEEILRETLAPLLESSVDEDPLAAFAEGWDSPSILGASGRATLPQTAQTQPEQQPRGRTSGTALLAGGALNHKLAEARAAKKQEENS